MSWKTSNSRSDNRETGEPSVFFARPENDAAGEESFAEGLAVGFDAPRLCQLEDFFELGGGGFFAEDLPDLEEADEAIAHPHGYGAVGQAGGAGDGLGALGGL
jgi:hypothetical protein